MNIKENEFLTGWALWRNHLIAMLMKKVLSTVRSWILFIIQNIIPVTFLIIAIIVAKQMYSGNDLPNLNMTLDSYDNPVTVIATNREDNVYYAQYKQLLRSEGRELIDWGTEDLNERLLNVVIYLCVQKRFTYLWSSNVNIDEKLVFHKLFLLWLSLHNLSFRTFCFHKNYFDN